MDGVGALALADSLLDPLTARGRPSYRISSIDFLRPAGERYEYGREDADAFRDRWLDAGALRREVLERPGCILPALRDPGSDRSSRAARITVPDHGVIVVDGVFLLGCGLPADLVVHVALSPAALRRRGVPAWQLPAFASYEEECKPRDLADAVVLAEDPRRPAVGWRHSLR